MKTLGGIACAIRTAVARGLVRATRWALRALAQRASDTGRAYLESAGINVADLLREF